MWTKRGGRTPHSRSTVDANEYWYARFDDGVWHTHFLAHAGSALYGGEAYYTGLVALDPGDPGRVVVSTDVHPTTGVPLISAADGQQHHELFEGITTDGGATWDWTTITADSTMDNLRPIIPIWDSDQRALLWLRGVYTKYTEYDLDVVAIITDRRRRITASSRRGRHRGGRRCRASGCGLSTRRTTSVASTVLT